jgi:hypothetical protein
VARQGDELATAGPSWPEMLLGQKPRARPAARPPGRPVERPLASSPMSLLSSYWKRGQARKAAQDEKRWPSSDRWSRARCNSRSGSFTRSQRSSSGASRTAVATPTTAMATPTGSGSAAGGGGVALAAALTIFGQAVATQGGKKCIRPKVKAMAAIRRRSRFVLLLSFLLVLGTQPANRPLRDSELRLSGCCNRPTKITPACRHARHARPPPTTNHTTTPRMRQTGHTHMRHARRHIGTS